eukprot:NODE_5_length_72347_cov_1.339331.p46 type:complete len:180 gc:universal NODE_5_length_72347_cov_1.339331:38522-39061(+)
MIPEIGAIIGGLILNGCALEDEVYHLGPLPDGSSVQVKVKSIHRQRSCVNELKCGQAGTVCIEPVLQHILLDSKSKEKGIRLRKGMVLLKGPLLQFATEFTAICELITDEGIQGVSLDISGKVYIGSMHSNGKIRKYTHLKEKQYHLEITLSTIEWIRSGLKFIFFSKTHGLKFCGSIQ